MSKESPLVVLWLATTGDLVYREIIGQGFTKEGLERVYSPIGTDIGAETPEELALGIVGQLVKVRSEKNSDRRKGRGGDSTPCCRIQSA